MDKEAVFDRLQGARDFNLNIVNPNVTKHCRRVRDTSIPQEYKWWWETKLSRHYAFVKSISLLPGNKLTDLFFLSSLPAWKSLRVPTLEPAMTTKPVFLRTSFGQEATIIFPNMSHDQLSHLWQIMFSHQSVSGLRGNTVTPETYKDVSSSALGPHGK